MKINFIIIYQMSLRDLGKIITMYGGAISDVENEYHRLRQQKNQKSNLINTRYKLEKLLHGAQIAIQDAKNTQ